ncbi:MAG TPA: 16S rRNA (cytosine(1402)-N(4))-methyltransferase RsmH [Stellaceae bacterium]|jgi:16S rRNA (cytosine1402-N4)-methyltransferase|nr:16S rRNA (cytosine(1402)-N(4))-methyltransferase RsmH [Stellaceae bacterium]
MRRPPRQPAHREAPGALPPGATGNAARHLPVMVDAVVEALAPRDDALYVDGTFGDGGYSRALLDAAHCRVVAIDRDPEAVRRGRELAAGQNRRFEIVEGNFGDMARLVAEATGPVAGIALDLGVSSFQIDTPERGFSFRFDGPLDMRMSAAGRSAADLVASLPEEDLARLIRDFGEERHARRIARAIVFGRRQEPIGRTLALAELVRAAIPKAEPGIDPATRTFQALRIAVNDELAELASGLAAAERLLMPGGRLAVVSFHSLEDRRVKEFLRQRSDAAPRASRHEPTPAETTPPSFRLLHRRALRPSPEEVGRNPRARSARLRAAERTTENPWPRQTDRREGWAA